MPSKWRFICLLHDAPHRIASPCINICWPRKPNQNVFMEKWINTIYVHLVCIPFYSPICWYWFWFWFAVKGFLVGFFSSLLSYSSSSLTKFHSKRMNNWNLSGQNELKNGKLLFSFHFFHGWMAKIHIWIAVNVRSQYHSTLHHRQTNPENLTSNIDKLELFWNSSFQYRQTEKKPIRSHMIYFM